MPNERSTHRRAGSGPQPQLQHTTNVRLTSRYAEEEILGILNQALRPLEDQFTHGREYDLTPEPIDKQTAKVILQRSNAFAQCPLRDVQGISRLAEGANACKRDEVLELTRFHYSKE